MGSWVTLVGDGRPDVIYDIFCRNKYADYSWVLLFPIPPSLSSSTMPRERSMSGTIPSMETSHDELKDNTIIVGVSRDSLPV